MDVFVHTLGGDEGMTLLNSWSGAKELGSVLNFKWQTNSIEGSIETGFLALHAPSGRVLGILKYFLARFT